MEKNVKTTSRTAITYVMENFDLPDHIAEKFSAMLTALDKKASADRKPTAKQVENAAIAEKMYNVLLNNGEPMTVTEIVKADILIGNAVTSNQHATSIVGSLVKSGKVVRIVDKGRAKFAIA